MPARALAVPLLLAMLAACGGGQETAPPPAVTCGTTADSGTLVVNDPATCGTASGFGVNGYAFTTGSAGTCSVTLWTTFGDADLHVYDPGGALVGSSFNLPPSWKDQVVFRAAASTTYAVDVEDMNAAGSSSTYAVQVTGP